MKESSKDTLRLEIPAHRKYLPLATTFAERAGLAFGLREPDNLALALAVEEIISGVDGLALPLTLEARNGLYYTEIDLIFPYTELSLGKMNLTASIQGEHDLEAVGWVVASQMVDRLTVENPGRRSTRFRVLKMHRYSVLGEDVSLPTSGSRVVEIRLGHGQELILFARRVLAYGKARELYHDPLEPPARMADLVASGDYEALLAVSERGDPVAGVLIERGNSRLARVYGPYLVGAAEEVLEQLFHEVLRHLARTSVIGVMMETDAPIFSLDEVERLGARRLRLPAGGELQLNTYFRALREDPGLQSWATPSLQEYLRAEYQRLTLPRDVQLWRQVPGSIPDLPSVIACDFRRAHSSCLMRPVLPGQDMAENLASHLALLDSEGLLNIFFELDLGCPEHLAFAASLDSQGFRAAVLLPGAGHGDLLLLERRTT